MIAKTVSDEVISEDNRSIISYESRNNGLNLNVNLRYMKDYYVWNPFIESRCHW